MIKKAIPLVTGIILLILGCVIMIHARKWLATWWGLHGSGWFYFWLICLLMAIINYLAMRMFLMTVDNKLKTPQSSRSSEAKDPNISDTTKTYRHSRIKVLVLFIISLDISMGGFTFDDPGKPMVTAVYIMEFCLSVPILLWAMQDKISYVEINLKEIIINGFQMRKFLIADMAKVQFKSINGSRYIIITLKNDDEHIIGGTLENYRELVDTLKKCVLKNGGRWFS